MRVELDCCNPCYGCPHCFCITCWNDSKLPECAKIKDKPHIKISLLCQSCIKLVKNICFKHYWSSLLDMREIKHERLQDAEYKNKISLKIWTDWKSKFNNDK